MEPEEIRELTISALIIAIAFAIASNGGISSLLHPASLLIGFLYSTIAVSIGFILHELAHRFTARRFGCYAEYRMWKTGLLISLLTSLFGFLFAAPGAVVIHPRIDLWGRIKTLTRKESGIIAAAGPVANFIVSFVFILSNLLWNHPILYSAAYLNAFLGIFNLIPFPPLDGEKILIWDKKMWGLLLVSGIILLFFTVR